MLQNYSRRNRRSSAGCENMESLQIRQVPSGSLTAGLQNRVLTVAGDHLGNDVVIQKNITGQTTVAGIHQTLINGVAPVNGRSLAVFQGVTDVVVKTNGGQHNITMTSVPVIIGIFRDVTVDSGAANDTLKWQSPRSRSRYRTASRLARIASRYCSCSSGHAGDRG